MKRSLTGSLVVCVAAAAFTAGALVLNDDSPVPAAVPAAAGGAPAPAGGAYPGPGGGSTATATAAPATLEIKGLAFGPVTAARGGRVVVQNRDNVAHTVTAAGGEFDTGIGAKATATLTAPATAGSYHFTCLIHPRMSGTLVVR